MEIVSAVFVLMIVPTIKNLYNIISSVYFKYILIGILVVFTAAVANSAIKSVRARKSQIKTGE